VLKYAIEKHRKSQIFIKDRGRQFTSDVFIKELKENKIMFGRERWCFGRYIIDSLWYRKK